MKLTDIKENFKRSFPLLLRIWFWALGKHPSHVTVYKIINSYLQEQDTTVRHPGLPVEGKILQTTEGILEITHSNQIWQIDHTKLDILLIDEEDRKVIGRPYITLVMDSYSGCVTGFYLGFESAGSHEVGLARPSCNSAKALRSRVRTPKNMADLWNSRIYNDRPCKGI